MVDHGLCSDPLFVAGVPVWLAAGRQDGWIRGRVDSFPDGTFYPRSGGCGYMGHPPVRGRLGLMGPGTCRLGSSKPKSLRRIVKIG